MTFPKHNSHIHPDASQNVWLCYSYVFLSRNRSCLALCVMSHSVISLVRYCWPTFQQHQRWQWYRRFPFGRIQSAPWNKCLVLVSKRLQVRWPAAGVANRFQLVQGRRPIEARDYHPLARWMSTEVGSTFAESTGCLQHLRLYWLHQYSELYSALQNENSRWILPTQWARTLSGDGNNQPSIQLQYGAFWLTSWVVVKLLDQCWSLSFSSNI